MADEKKGTNIANGVFNAIVILCGIAFCVLIDFMLKQLLSVITGFGGSDTFNLATYATVLSVPVWTIGLAFIVPGLIGIIATFTRSKCAYITQMVFAIITLIVMGILSVAFILAFTAINIYNYADCYESGNTCFCINTEGLSVGITTSSSLTCNNIRNLGGFSIGLTAALVVGWVATLAATVTGGMLACASEKVQPGAVIVSSQNPGPYGGYVGRSGVHGGYPTYQGQQGAPPGTVLYA